MKAATRRDCVVWGQIWSSSQRWKKSRASYPPWWKEIWNCDHGNPNVQEEQEGYMHREMLMNKKNPRKLLEEIVSCEVKYGVPVSNGKKVAQLICLGGRKKYGTVITVAQMCKKSKKVICTMKHIVDEMWKQWQIEGCINGCLLYATIFASAGLELLNHI